MDEDVKYLRSSSDKDSPIHRILDRLEKYQKALSVYASPANWNKADVWGLTARGWDLAQKALLEPPSDWWLVYAYDSNKVTISQVSTLYPQLFSTEVKAREFAKQQRTEGLTVKLFRHQEDAEGEKEQ